MNRIEASNGEILECLPKGTRVRHYKHRDIIGEIVGYEYHESGKISPVPYKVYWDNSDEAFDKLGFMNIYQCINTVVPIKDTSERLGL